MSTYIIDLDGTVICSKHRKLTRADGSLDLEHWIENNRAEKIQLDSLLPLAVTMRKAYFSGIHTVLVCTARVLSVHDYSFLMEHNLPYHTMLDRPNGCNMPDHELKDVQLRIYAHNQGMSWARFAAQSICYDDNQAVLTRMTEIGIATMDAVQINRAMAL
jgi:hypothetical protein